MTDPAFLLALVAALLGGASLVLHVVAPRTKNTIDDQLRDDIDEVLAWWRGRQAGIVPGPAPVAAPVPRNPQSGRIRGPLLGAIALIGMVCYGLYFNAVMGCAASQAGHAAVAGVVTALDCEDARIDATLLADAKTFADAKVLQWLTGALAPDAARIKADLAPIKTDLGRCAIAGALAAITATAAATPGTAVSALSGGPPPGAVQAQFSIAARQLGWAPVKVAGGAVL